MRTPRRHGQGTLRIDRLLGLYRLYHLNPRSVLAVSPCHIGSIQRIARGAAIAPDLHECLILRCAQRASKDEECVPRMLRSAKRCAADPGSLVHFASPWVPALRCIVKNAAPRP